MSKRDYIPFNDFVPYADELLRGEQIHINHDACTAGVDTKRRLYIKRTEDGTTILAYCHNCSLHGRYVKDYARVESAKAEAKRASQDDNYPTAHCGGGQSEKSSNRVSLPADCESDVSSWNKQHRVWVTKYGIIDQKELNLHKICASEDKNAVILPVFRDKTLLGYQERTFSEGKPKYVTRRAGNKPLWWYSEDLLQSTRPPETIAIVEDVLSGIKCARHVPTVALMGSSLGDDLLAFLLDKALDKTKFTIFLDDDNRQIRLNQLKIKVKLEQCGHETRIVTGVGKDPKECSDEELKKRLL